MTIRRKARKPRKTLRTVQQERPRPQYPIALLALVGAGLSIYLTYLHFSGATAGFCAPGSGCDLVRASPYSRLLGIPVALLGVLGYAAIATTALLPFKERTRRVTLHLLSAAGLAFAAYLTYRELFTIRAICPYCVASAVVMAAIWVMALRLRALMERDWAKPLRAASLVAVVVLAAAFLLPQSLGPAAKADAAYREALARHLTAQGAVMYGAYWCPHCAEQKRLFGDAFRYVNYVECDPGGSNPQPQLCQQKGVRAYPTWEIGGRMYEGTMTLEELANLSGFSPATG